MKQVFIFSDKQDDNIRYYELEPAILVSMDRSDLPYLKEKDFGNFSAIYILIGGNRRYVGQAAGQSVYQRLSQHILNEEKSWFDSVIFFSKTSGKLSKADTDYLEKRLIKDFKDNSDYELVNSTMGNNSYIGQLEKAKSDQLYDTVFEIIGEVANLDLFGTLDTLDTEKLEKDNNNYWVMYKGNEISSYSVRHLYIKTVKKLFDDADNEKLLNEMVVDGEATYAFPLGKRFSTYSGKPNAIKVHEGIYLYINLSRKGINRMIHKFADQLNIKFETNI